MEHNSNEIHECQCDGPGHCSVYNMYMNQDRYNKCKHDASWRHHYKKLFLTLHNDEKGKIEREKQIHETLNAYAEMHKQLRDIEEQEQDRLRQKWKEYLQQELDKIDKNFVNMLSPQEKEAFKNMDTTIAEQQKAGVQAHRQLDQVVAQLQEEGIDLDANGKEAEGMGDKINNILSSVGVSEETLSVWLGLKGGGCGCSKRQKFLNKIFPSNKKE